MMKGAYRDAAEPQEELPEEWNAEEDRGNTELDLEPGQVVVYVRLRVQRVGWEMGRVG